MEREQLVSGCCGSSKDAMTRAQHAPVYTPCLTPGAVLGTASARHWPNSSTTGDFRRGSGPITWDTPRCP
ncbi:MAG: hypothetical protein JWR48_7082 [Mycobacterium sp.]|nr:hypothetical protein [Mycobacterium sp.]